MTQLILTLEEGVSLPDLKSALKMFRGVVSVKEISKTADNLQSQAETPRPIF